MATIPESFSIAVRYHQAGRLHEAERIYRQILAVDPVHADAWHLLGVVAHQVGKQEAARDCIEKAIGLKSSDGRFFSNLGEVYRALHKAPEAVAAYHRALRLMPNSAEIHYNLANALKDQGQAAEAVANYRRAIALRPDHVQAHNNLGTALKEQGETAEAIRCFKEALRLQPAFAEACNNLGLALHDRGELVQAVATFRRAAQLRPDFAEVYTNLGNVLGDQGQRAEAITAHRHALQLKPDLAVGYYNLAYALQADEQLSEAVACCRRALELKPDYAEAHNNLGVILKDQGEVSEALACFQQALDHQPDHVESHSNLLLTLQYKSGVTAGELATAHAAYQRQHAAALRALWPAHENGRDPQRRLRLGFLSPDFGQHPVGFFLLQVMENLDREACETFCYCDRRKRDELTARFEAAATHWQNVAGTSDQWLAEKIHADQVDILFDLTGHTARNRMLVIARKPAPIQITWLGYEGTTGLEAIDYLLADRYVAPEGSESHFCERVLRMPENYVCYDPPAAAPAVGDLPALRQGHITFGSFNNLAKINPEVLSVWARLLGRLPESRLILKYKGLGDARVRQRILAVFSAAGISPERIGLLPPSSYADYLATYNDVDIALDPFPFSGSATTCEALWMGVPMITCPGETFASRHGLSHLSTLGLTELIASDLDDYVQRAVALASDLQRLAALRAGLRQRMAASPLCDGKRFAVNLLVLLREAWQEWCEQVQSGMFP